MNRRNFLTSAVAAAVVPTIPAPLLAAAAETTVTIPERMWIHTRYESSRILQNFTAIIPYISGLVLGDKIGVSPDGQGTVRKFREGDQCIGQLVAIDTPENHFFEYEEDFRVHGRRMPQEPIELFGIYR